MDKPTFHMLSGLPGSGAGYIARSIGGAELLTQTLDEHEPGAHIREVLTRGESIVYDAPNLTYDRRVHILNALDGVDCRRVCTFVATPFWVCLERNARSDEPLENRAIRRMLTGIWIPQYYEGWDELNLRYGSEYSAGWEELFFEGNQDSPVALVEISQDSPHHNLTIGRHCLLCREKLLEKHPDSTQILERAALLHDIGKGFTKNFMQGRDMPGTVAHYPGHENAGAYQSLFYNSDFSIGDRLEIAKLIQWHMWKTRTRDEPNAAERVRALVGETVFKQLTWLHDADSAAK